MTCKNKKWGHNFIGGKCLDCGDRQQTLTVKHRGRKYEEEKKELSKHKIDYEYQEIGVEMSKYFKENIWWIFHKYPYPDIRQAFKVCREKGIYTIGYLREVLKRI